MDNVWISASAGSGKTKALTDRTLRLLLGETDPSKILCLTYTKAAAAEMLQRITSELRNWIILDDHKLTAQITTLTGTNPDAKTLNFARTLLIKILDAKHALKIQTIHSFCQSIIAKFPIESGLNLGTKIIDDFQKQILLKQAKLAILQEHGSHPELQPLLTNIHEFSFNTLIEKAIHYRYKLRHLQTHEIATLFATDNSLSEPELFQKFNKEFNQLTSQHLATLQEIVGSEENAFASTIINYTTANAEQKEQLFPNLYNVFYTAAHSPRKTLLGHKIIQYYQLENFLYQISSSIDNYLEIRNSYRVAKYSKSFIYLVHLIDLHYQDLKSAKAVIDYDDLINITLEMLSSEQLLPWIMYKLDGKIEHILVDESQDISAEQWQIIAALTNDFFCELGSNNLPRTIFAVGDQKQSIFSFQGADPKLFNQTKNYYSQLLSDFAIKLETQTLTKSFRSGAAILRVVDETFGLLTSNSPEAFIEPQMQHIAHKNIHSQVELWPAVICEKKKKPEDCTWQIHTDRLTAYDPAKILSQIIADEVWQLLSSNQDIQPQDILILIRKRDKFAEYLVRAFKDRNIPISGLDRIKLNQNLAIKDLLAVANFILLPHDDYNFACLLKSPLFNYTEEQLLGLSQLEGASWWSRHCEPAQQTWQSPAISFLTHILDNHALHTPYNLFSYLLNNIEVRQKIVTRFGNQINEILDEFLQICLEYEKNEGTSLQKFCNWFATTNIEIKRETDNQANLVRVMTTHAAKGLQSKIVILADTMSMPKYSQKIIWSNQLGLPLYNGTAGNNNQAYNQALSDYKLQALQEYYRLLYVAMTRAEERLIICGWTPFTTITEGSWYDLVHKAMQKIGTTSSLHPEILTFSQ